MSADATPTEIVTPAAQALPLQTIATADGEIYVRGDVIVGRKVVKSEYGSKITKYYRGDKLHREDGPAFIQEGDNGNILAEQYYIDGKSHREGDAPACIYRTNDGVCYAESYFKNGKYHRDGNKPAKIQWAGDVIVRELYYRDGKLHRDGDEPAGIIKNVAGKVTCARYYRAGMRHRDGGAPACIETNARGDVIMKMEYYRDDKPGRPGGLPTTVEWDVDGKLIKVMYVSDGVKIKLTGEKAAEYENKAFVDNSAAELKQKLRALLE